MTLEERKVLSVNQSFKKRHFAGKRKPVAKGDTGTRKGLLFKTRKGPACLSEGVSKTEVEDVGEGKQGLKTASPGCPRRQKAVSGTQSVS
jgi:hypothetical protein